MDTLSAYVGRALTLYVQAFDMGADGVRVPFKADGQTFWLKILPETVKPGSTLANVVGFECSVATPSELTALKTTANKTEGNWLVAKIPGGDTGFAVMSSVVVAIYAGTSEIDQDIKSTPFRIFRITEGDEVLT